MLAAVRCGYPTVYGDIAQASDFDGRGATPADLRSSSSRAIIGIRTRQRSFRSRIDLAATRFARSPLPARTRTAQLAFQVTRGVAESVLEGQIAPATAGAGRIGSQRRRSIFRSVGSRDPTGRDLGQQSRAATARSPPTRRPDHHRVEQGYAVIVPSQSVTIDGTRTIGLVSDQPDHGGDHRRTRGRRAPGD